MGSPKGKGDGSDERETQPPEAPLDPPAALAVE